jgi:transketolase
VLYDEADFKFEIGKGVQVEDGNDVTIIANGLLVNEAIVQESFSQGRA